MNSLGNRRWWVLGALVVILLAVSLDLTALNVALPTDRGPHAHGRRLGGHHPVRDVGDARGLPEGGAAPGARRLGRRVLPGTAARPHHRRLPARPLLVGIDLLHQ